MGPDTVRRGDILVIEDDDYISYLLEFMLTREGFNVTRIIDGNTASQHIATMAPPILILLDIMLPFKDGFQLLTEIRAKSELNQIPVIVLTTKSQESDIATALKNGANDYITKPFQPMELHSRLKRHLKLISA